MNILSSFTLLSLYFLITPLYSVSAPPFPYEVEQPDGGKITVRMFGHEYYSWIETKEGYVIDWVEDENRLGWYYCELNSEGQFSPSFIPVTFPALSGLEIPKYLRETFPRVREFRHESVPRGSSHQSPMGRKTSTTQIRPLVFLVDFIDLPLGMSDKTYTKEQFKALLFEPELNPNDWDLPSNYNMSVRDYYYEVSNDKLEIFGDDESIVNWVTAKNSYSYYVDGEHGTGQGPNGPSQSAAALLVEVIMKKHEEITFSDFDGDDDGVVDCVILIIKGWMSGIKNQFWPHMSTIPSSIISNDFTNGVFAFQNKVIKKFIVIPEQYHLTDDDFVKKKIHPIGTICHEIGHILGLPDLYDTMRPENDKIRDVSEWGLMAAGNWNKQNSPSYPNAWSRYRLGIINPAIVENTEETYLTIKPTEGRDDSAAYILPMSSHYPQEYLIVENRQKKGSDQNLKNSGLLVWHIDETITDIYPALITVNVNLDFFGVNLIQADKPFQNNTHTGFADSGDPFPGSQNVTELSNLNLNSYDRNVDGISDRGENSNIIITSIIENQDSSINCIVTNPNKKGKIMGEDEGNLGIYTSSNFLNSNYDWSGVKIFILDSTLLSGVMIPYTQNTTEYKIKIWKGWNNNKPDLLIDFHEGDWIITEEYRESGWAFISYIDKSIVLSEDEVYYVEVNYPQLNNLRFFDYSNYSSSTASNLSFFRSNSNSQPQLFQIGDWNLRVVLSGDKDFEALSTEFVEFPKEHQIYSNYPNPFNPVTTLSIFLENPSEVSFSVFDLKGRQISQNYFPILGGGRHEFEVKLASFSSGVYFYKFVINNENYSPKKMALMK